jgi:hypothetical protein
VTRKLVNRNFDNLISPLTGSVAFRFTPIGAGSGWQIDDLSG